MTAARRNSITSQARKCKTQADEKLKISYLYHTHINKQIEKQREKENHILYFFFMNKYIKYIF